MKTRVLWVMGIGALFGGGLSSWLAPKMIAWYFNPPVQFGVSCVESIQWALKRLQWAQVIGVAVGALAALVLYIAVRRRRPPQVPQEPTTLEPTR